MCEFPWIRKHASSIHPSNLSFSVPPIFLRVPASMEPNPGCSGYKAKDTLDGMKTLSQGTIAQIHTLRTIWECQSACLWTGRGTQSTQGKPLRNGDSTGFKSKTPEVQGKYTNPPCVKPNDIYFIEGYLKHTFQTKHPPKHRNNRDTVQN